MAALPAHHSHEGFYVFDLGFRVDDRFISATPGFVTYPAVLAVCTDINGTNCTDHSLTANQVEVDSADIDNEFIDTKVYLIVY